MIYLMILCMNDTLMLMIVMDIIPNYNECIFFASEVSVSTVIDDLM